MSGLLFACAPSPEEVAAERRALLEDYLDAERTVLADLVGQTSTYKDADVEGGFEGDAGGDEFPTTVVTFTYTYSERVWFSDPSAFQPSWEPPSRPLAELDTMKIALIAACNSQLFPAMRSAGLTGALHVEYVYLNPGAWTAYESWSVSCSSPSP
jgi:hypothetical protein